MGATLKYTLLFVLFFLLAVAAVASLAFFLRKLTVEYAKAEVPDKQHWWRYAVPTFLVLFTAIWQGMDASMFNFLYLIVACIGIPFAIAYYSLKEVLEKKNERLSMLLALLFLVSATIYAADWFWHFRSAHAAEMDAGTFENPHVFARNCYMIPLWLATILLGGTAGYLWRKEGRKENEDFLPSYYVTA